MTVSVYMCQPLVEQLGRPFTRLTVTPEPVSRAEFAYLCDRVSALERELRAQREAAKPKRSRRKK